MGESLRIEVGGDLHASGGLNGRLVDREEAESLVSKSKSPAQHQTRAEGAVRDYIAVYNTHHLELVGVGTSKGNAELPWARSQPADRERR